MHTHAHRQYDAFNACQEYQSQSIGYLDKIKIRGSQSPKQLGKQSLQPSI